MANFISFHVYGVKKWSEEMRRLNGYVGSTDDPMREYQQLALFTRKLGDDEAESHNLKHLGETSRK